MVVVIGGGEAVVVVVAGEEEVVVVVVGDETVVVVMGGNETVVVVTGDIQTDNDARRLARFGFPVRQITTAGACHLDARMVEKSLEGWDLTKLDLLLIENVGNLVCPTSYDLGEQSKIVILSVTEGDDKPLKYPGAFAKSRLMVLNKIDLLPYVPFDMEAARRNARSIHPGIDIIETSCTTGNGLDVWRQWIGERMREAVARSRPT